MRRFSYQDWVKTAPGISPTSPSGSSVLVSALGPGEVPESETASPLGHPLDLRGRRAGPEDVSKRRFDHLVPAAANALDRGPGFDVRDDADALRGLLVRVEHADPADHRSQ